MEGVYGPETGRNELLALDVANAEQGAHRRPDGPERPRLTDDRFHAGECFLPLN